MDLIIYKNITNTDGYYGVNYNTKADYIVKNYVTGMSKYYSLNPRTEIEVLW